MESNDNGQIAAAAQLLEHAVRYFLVLTLISTWPVLICSAMFFNLVHCVQVHYRGLWGPRLLCHEEAGLFKTSILRIFTSSKASLSKVHHMLTCSRKRGCCPSCRCCFSSCPTSIIDPLSLVFMQMCCRQLLPPAQVHASRCQVNFLTYLLVFLHCL